LKHEVITSDPCISLSTSSIISLPGTLAVTSYFISYFIIKSIQSSQLIQSFIKQQSETNLTPFNMSFVTMATFHSGRSIKPTLTTCAFKSR